MAFTAKEWSATTRLGSYVRPQNRIGHGGAPAMLPEGLHLLEAEVACIKYRNVCFDMN